MTLPVSPDHPQVPFTQYSPNQPPVIPMVRRAQTLAYLVPAVASAIANEAGSKAHANAARMFTYNLLSNNYWSNEFFTEAVNLCLEYVDLEYRRGRTRMPESAIQDAAMNVMMLYTSSMLFLFPDLQRRVSPDVQEAAMRNAPVFNNFKLEIDSMYGNNPGHQPMMHGHPGGQPMQYGHPPMPQVMMGPQGPMIQMPNGQWVSAMQMPNGQWVPAQQMVHSPPHGHMSNYPVNPQGLGHMQQTTFQPVQSGHGRTFNAASDSLHVGFRPGSPGYQAVEQDRFAKKRLTALDKTIIEVNEMRAKNNAQTQVNQETSSTVDGSQSQLHVLKISEGSEMQRSQHQITYFGTAYALPTSERAQQHVASVDKLASEVVDSPENICVYPSWLIEPSVDDAVVTAKIKQISKQNGSSNRGVFRCFTVIPSTFVCDVEVADYVKSLREAENFADLAAKFKSIAAAFQAKNEHKGYAESVIPFLAAIDNRLTDMVNEFIPTGLEGTAWITSFSEDIVELFVHVKKKSGEIGIQALRNFEREVMSTFIHEQYDEDLTSESEADSKVTDSVHTALFPMNHSVTTTFMTSKELGYQFGPYNIRSIATIDENTAPSLYKLMQSLQSNKRDMNMTTLVDYLVSADGVRYRLFSSYVNPGVFMIKKVSISG